MNKKDNIQSEEDLEETEEKLRKEFDEENEDKMKISGKSVFEVQKRIKEKKDER